MNTTFADLWRPSGTVDRKTYALVGLAGFAISFLLGLLATFLGTWLGQNTGKSMSSLER